MTVKEELIQIIDKMPEENITRVIELIKSNEYLDEAIDMENSGKLYNCNKKWGMESQSSKR